MKVLHIGKYWPPVSGGIESFLYDLTDELSSRPIKQTVLVHDSPTRNNSDTRNHTTVVFAPVLAQFAFAPISIEFPFQLRKICKTDPPDLIHIHLPNVSAFWLLLFARCRKIPWILHWHADVVPSPHALSLRLLHPLYKWFEKKLLDRCAVVIGTSTAYIEASEPLQAYREKCQVIPLGIDPDKALPTEEQDERIASTRWLDDDLRVLFIGRLAYYKGVDVLLHAVARLEGVQLIVVGDGEKGQELRQKAQALNLTDRVQFTGVLNESDKQRLLLSSEVLCLPSIERTEAFGVVLLEAMRSGKPVIASNLEGTAIPGVVEAGVTGFLPMPGSVDDLESVLIQCKDNRFGLAEMGKAGYQKLISELSLAGAASKVYSTYEYVSKGS